MPFISGRPLSPGTKRLGFAANADLQFELDNLATQRHKYRSEIIRMLLWLDLETYETNRLEGNTTGQRRQAQAAQRRAEAEAKAARKKHPEPGANYPILVPLEFDDE